MARHTFPGWNPYQDPASLAERTRWLWLVPLAAGFLAVLGIVLTHDDPGPGLSNRGWFTLALAALLAVLLTIHRNAGQLLRATAEYVVVALLAVLLITATGMHHTPAPAANHPPSRAGVEAKAAGDACPSIVQVRDWLAWLWQAGLDAARRSHPPTTTKPKGHAMAPSPTPGAPLQENP
jgi:hypothetical protein